MIERRSFDSLGAADHGWLDARHHFSFAGYHDPSRMGWGALRVWNDDTIAPNSGFPPHPHANMEIVTYVREGAITHEDSLGRAKDFAEDWYLALRGKAHAASADEKRRVQTRRRCAAERPREGAACRRWLRLLATGFRRCDRWRGRLRG